MFDRVNNVFKWHASVYVDAKDVVFCFFVHCRYATNELVTQGGRGDLTLF